MSSRFSDLIITKWHARFMGITYPCAIGRGGIGIKKGEGDSITPIGSYKLEWVYARSDRLHVADIGFYQPTPLKLGWSDAANDPFYNQPVKLPYKKSHEKLRRADPLYNIVGVLDYNRNPIVAGNGSAIFLHVWRKPRHPTEGCIAFKQYHLQQILNRWAPDSKVVIKP